MQAIRVQSIFHVIFFILLLLYTQFSYVHASIEDEAEINIIFEVYGKKNVANFISKERNGQITIQKKKSFRNIIGRPNIKFITEKSVIQDLQILKIDIDTLKNELDVHIKSEKKKQRDMDIRLTEPDSTSNNQSPSLSVELKNKMKVAQNKYNKSESNSERRRLKRELSILRKAYKSAKENERSKLRVYFPDKKSKTTRSGSYCKNLKSQLTKLTNSVYRHQIFFCNDRGYREENPASCRKYRRGRQYSLSEYKAEVSRVRTDFTSNCGA